MNHVLQQSVYSSLILVDDQIRLVRLLPRVLSDDIEIELIHADLASKPRYEALSYEWGPPSTSTSPVFIHGECQFIQENLWWALRNLRLESKARILWIDALCINQDDLGERNHQVAQMGMIYEQSSRVIIWMGYLNTSERDRDTAIAVRFLRGIKLNSSEFVYRPNQPWGSLAKLCYKTYWTRLWIIQEVVLATNILVQCGDYSFGWNSLAVILDQLDNSLDSPTSPLRKTADEFGYIRRSIPGRLNRQRIARQSTHSKAQPLLDLIFTYKEAGCVNPRDKVFGLHSLAASCCRKAISIDYAKSPFEIGGMVLKHHIFNHMEETELSAVPACRDLQKLIKAKVPFVVSSRSLRPMDCNYASAKHKLIHISGYVEGTISWLSPFFDSYPSDEDSISSTFAAYQTMMDDVPQILMVMSTLTYPLEFWTEYLLNLPGPLYKETDHVGLTFSLPGSNSFATMSGTQLQPVEAAGRMQKLSNSLKASLRSRASSLSDKRGVKDAEKISRWWKWLVSPCSKSERPRTRILFTGNGLISFGPGSADIGDVVCQIEQSDGFVVLRPRGLQYEIIGRSSCIKHPGIQNPDVRPRVQLYVDISTLQLLS
jgi:hypothetical protein